MRDRLVRLCLFVSLYATGCSSIASVPCASDVECAAYGAACVAGACHRPSGGELVPISDAPVSVGGAPDLADAPDGAEPPPDLAPVCTRAACLASNVTAPRCDPASASCQPCRQGANEALDCPEAASPACGADGSCRQRCTSHADCASGLCDPGIITVDARTCARADEIVHVNADASCTAVHTGSPADPVCSIDAALALLPSGGFIRIEAAGAMLPRAKTAMAKPYVIVGSGTISAPPEVVGPLTRYDPALVIGSGGRVYLEGLHITASAFGVFCDGSLASAKLVISSMNIESSVAYAVDASACEVSIDRLRVYSGSSGLRMRGGTLAQLTNSYFISNSVTAIAVSPTTIIADRVGFLTLVKNGLALSCGAAMNIRSSISWFNTASFDGPCAFSSSDVDPAVPGNTNLAPSFPMLGGKIIDWHLKGHTGNNDACCVDHGAAMSGINTDFDGQPRNGAPDVGADEL